MGLHQIRRSSDDQIRNGPKILDTSLKTKSHHKQSLNYQDLKKEKKLMILNYYFKNLGLQLLVLQPCVSKSEEEAPSLKALISDPYIIIASGN